MNGAAAHKVNPGDSLIIIAYATLPINMAKIFQPKVLLFDDLKEDQYSYNSEAQSILFKDGIIPTYQVLRSKKTDHQIINFLYP